MRPPLAGGDDAAMAKTITLKQLRELRVETATAVRLVRRFAPHLVRDFFERLAVEDRVRKALSPPKRRASRPLKVGIAAVGVAAAGVAAARLAGHHGPFDDGGPDTDRA
jgi:hypothetical protein